MFHLRRVGAETYLGRNDEIILLPSKLLDCFAENNLRLSAGIYLRRVKEVHACVVCSFHTIECGF